jgi:hypothetical protein
VSSSPLAPASAISAASSSSCSASQSVDTHAPFLGGFGDDGPDGSLLEASNAALKTDTFPSGQTAPRWPFRRCGMQPTVSGLSQLDEPPGPYRAHAEALEASEPRDAHPRGSADPIQSPYARTDGSNMMTRFVRARRLCHPMDVGETCWGYASHEPDRFSTAQAQRSRAPRLGGTPRSR